MSLISYNNHIRLELLCKESMEFNADQINVNVIRNVQKRESLVTADSDQFIITQCLQNAIQSYHGDKSCVIVPCWIRHNISLLKYYVLYRVSYRAQKQQVSIIVDTFDTARIEGIIALRISIGPSLFTKHIFINNCYVKDSPLQWNYII